MPQASGRAERIHRNPISKHLDSATTKTIHNNRNKRIRNTGVLEGIKRKIPTDSIVGFFPNQF